MRKVTDKARTFFAPTQLGVASPGGAEIIFHLAAGILENDPEACLLATDVANAFNPFDRNTLWEPLRDHFPELGCLVWFLYGFASQQLLPDSEGGVASIPSTVGSRQGCSLGSFLFCLALQKTLNTVKSHHPHVTILAYANDVTLVGHPAKAVAAFREYTELNERDMHGELRPEKCVCNAPGFMERGEE